MFHDGSVRVLDELVNSGDLAERTIVLFGASFETRWLTRDLRLLGLEPALILDNDAHKHGTVFEGATVVGPAAVSTLKAEESVVLLTSRHYYSMSVQVRGLGYVGEIFRVVGSDSVYPAY